MTGPGEPYAPQSRTRRDEVAELASRQWGHVGVWQLHQRGIPKSLIRSWRESGWLRTIRYRGVYAVGHVPRSRRSEFMAAVLALGEGAALSHISAALLWGMLRIREDLIHVTCPRNLDSREDIRVHHSRGFEATTRWGIPVKTPLETIVDLAECLRSDEKLLRAINQGLVDELFTLDSLTEQLGRARGRRGVKRIKGLIHLATKSRSGLEDKVYAAAIARGESPLTNERIHGFEVDQYDPATNTATELDSAKYHGNPFARFLDALKTERLRTKGVNVRRRYFGPT